MSPKTRDILINALTEMETDFFLLTFSEFIKEAEAKLGSELIEKLEDFYNNYEHAKEFKNEKI